MLNVTDLNLRHIIGQESHLDQSRTGYMGLAVTLLSGHTCRASQYCSKLEMHYLLTCNESSYCVLLIAAVYVCLYPHSSWLTVIM